MSEILRVHRSTVLNLIRDGRLKAFEISTRGDKRIAREKLLDFMERQGVPLSFLETYETEQARRRILVVEDDKKYARILAGTIANKDRRLTVREAHRAAEGILLIGEFRPHLIVLDYYLPDMNADRLLEGTFEKRKETGAKVLLISARSRKEIAPTEEMEEKLGRLGVDEFIWKLEKVKTIRATALELLGLAERRKANNSV